MTYKQFVPLTNLNFQFNRLLTYGEVACREEELWEIAPFLEKWDTQKWYEKWNDLAVRAQNEGRTMHAAYYHRMSEFFLSEGHPEKIAAYHNFQDCFYQAVDQSGFEIHTIPCEGRDLPAMFMPAREEKARVLVHGGFDSFIEEFYLMLHTLVDAGYSVLSFEGPGQGRPLKEGIKMTPHWEKPVSAVLDHLGWKDAALVGVSLGGYLALRAAAFEPRITRVVAWDIIYDAFECWSRNIPPILRGWFSRQLLKKRRKVVNAFFRFVRKRKDLLDWALDHGMYITGAATPYDYFREWIKYSMKDISHLVKQDVLLLAGENDHFVPLEMYFRQKKALSQAKSVHGRIFREDEGADQHCQVGALDLAMDEIIKWLDRFYV